MKMHSHAFSTVFVVKFSLMKKQIQVEKYVCKTISNKGCVFEINVFQTIAGNIFQEIS